MNETKETITNNKLFSNGDADNEVDEENNSAKLFERSRIKALADERETVQKKTFCKWVNSQLARVGCKIQDLYVDLRDGRMLIKLLEILSGDKLPNPTKGKMRIHCLENVDKSLAFLNEQKVHLENMGAHDIVDGNARLTLGLIWTIILRFQIQDIKVESTGSADVRSAKDALLLWCQMKTAGYQNVNVRNFTDSWKNGLAFNALIHRHRPDLIDYNSLRKESAVANLNNAFDVAESKLGLTKLLDAEDVFTDAPDEKSIITYVVTYYHYFSKMKADSVQGRRVGKVLNHCLEDKEMIETYETLTSNLLEWIRNQIESLNDRDFANSLSGVQDQLSVFNNYRTVEKPVKFGEKGDLEILLFRIQSQMRGNNLKPYLPVEGKLVADINRAWEQLEKAEHGRELALREELARQEKLELLASRCDRKAGMRELWLIENQRLVSQDNFGYDMAAVEAAIKKHEAIETDIYAYEERVQAVVAVAKELEFENYHDIERINSRKDNVMMLWQYLLELLHARRTRLDLSYQLQNTFQDMLYILDMMDEIKVRLQSDDYGRHLPGVEDLLKKHELLQSEMLVIGSRVSSIEVQKFIDGDLETGYKPCDPEIVEDRLRHLSSAYDELKELFEDRQKKLLQSRDMWQFQSDLTEEESWIKEKEQLMSSPDIGHDLTSVQLLINKHKSDEEELRTHRSYIDDVLKGGISLIDMGNIGSAKVQEKIDNVEKQWQDLEDLSSYRKIRLEEALNFYQLFADAEDVDAWMMDMLRLVSSNDVGKDEASVLSLIKKQKQISKEIDSYDDVIKALVNQASLLGEKDRDSPEVLERVAGTEERYQDLKNKSEMRNQRLLNALALSQLYNEGDGVEQWITEKEKLVHTMVASEDVEEVEVLKARFDTFENEIESNADKIVVINKLAQQLVNEQHPDAEAVVSKQKQLNERWRGLRMLSDKKKEGLDLARDINQFYAECQETMTWINDKENLIKSTDELGEDLAGMIALRRRLSGLSRDIAVIQAMLNTLNEKAEDLAAQKPSESPAMKNKLNELSNKWIHLQEMMKERDERLGEANELQKFLQDLDHFQQWLSRTQALISAEEVPENLILADQMLAEHKNISDEIDAYSPQYKQMKDFGDKLVKGQEESQYMFLRERLKALDGDWRDLIKIWESKNNRLNQSRNLQEFLKEIKQVEILLSEQDKFLAKEEIISTPEQAEELIRQHKAFEATLDANDEKIKSVLDMGHKLVNENNYMAGKIQDKVDTIKHRQINNCRRSEDKLNRLKYQLDVLRLFQECDELSDWIGEKMLAVQDETYRDAKNPHSKWMRHQAFELELKSNKSRLEDVVQRSDELTSSKPDLKPTVEPKVTNLVKEWNDLEKNTKLRGEKLFDSNKHVLYGKNVDDIDGWINEVEAQIRSDDVFNKPIPINLIVKKQNLLESQLKIKEHQVQELSKQQEVLNDLDDEKKNILLDKKTSVEQRFYALLAPLLAQQQELEVVKKRRQFELDAAEELNWIDERLTRLSKQDVIKNLASVQNLLNKNKSLQVEVSNHRPRFEGICMQGEDLIESEKSKSADYTILIDLLHKKWQELAESLSRRNKELKESEILHQYLFDVGEAEAWIGEQEIYLMTEDKAKDEIGAENLLKRHKDRENNIQDFASQIKLLSENGRDLMLADASGQVANKQKHLERDFINLKQIAAEKSNRLIEVIKLYKLHFEIEDLERWIAEREVTASSHEFGNNFEHVILLLERFQKFAEETDRIGSDRVSAVNDICDKLIESGISDAPVVAEWKDGINESWTDLLELIETRNQALLASWQYFKLFNTCQDTLEQINEKKLSIPGEEVGEDSQSISALQRRLTNFENEILLLGAQVQGVQESASKLIVSYSGEKAQEIHKREEEVVNAWRDLCLRLESRKTQLANTFDANKFFILSKDLVVWMNDIERQMVISDKPRDISGVELLVNNHTSLKAEIDAREENFAVCTNLGKELFYKKHPMSKEIYSKLSQLATQRGELANEWDSKWEYLQLIHEVYLFARDAAIAESWISTHEPQIHSKYYGETIDVNEMLVRKHSALEKSMMTQKERFEALEKLTAVEILDRENEQPRKPSQVGKYMKEYLPIIKEEPKPSSIPLIPPKIIEPVLDEEKIIKESQVRISPAEKTPTTPIAPSTPEAEKPTPPPKSSTEKPSKSSSFRLNRSSSSGKDKKPKDSAKSPSSSDVIIEGTLNRKHEWESTIIKSTNRAWEKIFVVLLQEQALAFFKDSKHFKASDPKVYFRHELPIDLVKEKAKAAVATDYVKRPHVFRLKLESGAEYLFQCKDENEMNSWLTEINRQANFDPGQENKFATLPVNFDEKRSGSKKKGLFGIKKKE